MKYCLVFVIALSLSFGLVSESFRYQSTAGLFEDDYDLLFDPARIPEIEGSRLWTSLANLVTGNENLFSNTGVPYILVGGTKNLGNFYPGMVYDRSCRKDTLYTGLDDPYGNPMFGDGEVSYIDWIDEDGNGIFDRRIIETIKASAYELSQVNDFYIGLGTKRNSLRLGLAFMHNKGQWTYTNPDMNFTHCYTEENLNPTELTFEESVKSSGDEIWNMSQNEIILSGWLDKENMSIGLATKIGLLGLKDEAVILGDYNKYTNPSDTATDYTRGSILDSLMQPQSGTKISTELKLFRNYNENAQGRFYLDFFTESSGYKDDAVGYCYMTYEEIYNDFTYDTTTTITYYNGDKNSKGITLGTRQLFNISERLKFGFGLFIATSSYFDSTTAKDTTVSVEVYDNNDGISGPEDYVETTWSSKTWMTKKTGRINEFAIPVGLEFHLTEPLVFRLGARHTTSYDDYTTVTNLIQYEPERTKTVDGTGAVTETMEDPPNMPVGSEETNTITTPMTNYFYGIGWQVNDNLQIDLMGFDKITDLGNWRVSATLKFD